MRLLLTRGVEDAARTRARLEAAGHHVIVSPVITLVTLRPSWPRIPPQGLVASSARAFSGLDLGQPETRRALPLFLVGKQTAVAARARGFSGNAIVAPDAASLVTMIPGEPALRLVYLAGTHRKPDLEAGLAAQGHCLNVLETYSAEAAEALTAEARTALNTNAVDGMLHYSRRSAEIFLRLSAGLDMSRLAHFCLSRDVAAPLTAAGCHASIARRPDSDAMLEMVSPRAPV